MESFTKKPTLFDIMPPVQKKVMMMSYTGGMDFNLNSLNIISSHVTQSHLNIIA